MLLLQETTSPANRVLGEHCITLLLLLLIICKEVPSCTWRATDPTTHSYIAPQLSAGMHRKPAMLKPFLIVCGTSTSYSARDGLLPVHSLVLGLPATLRASTLLMMMTRSNSRCVRRTMLLSLLTTPAASRSSCPSRGRLRPHIAFAPHCRRGS